MLKETRSDVLSRHKRQCAVHLNGGAEENGGSAAAAAPSTTNKKSGASSRSRKGASKSGRKNSGGKDVEQSPEDDERDNDVLRRDYGQSPSNMILGGSFGFQQNSLPPPSAPPPLLPPAPYGTGEMANEFSRGAAGTANFGNVSHHLSALNSFTNQQHNYPSSPESNGTVSQHSSPRFASRDMSRHGSNSSRFSLRKNGGSFDHVTPRGSSTGTTSSSHYPQEFWEALDPAAKAASSMGSGNEFVSAPPASHPTFSLPAEATAAGALASAAIASASGPNVLNGGVTTPRGEPQRFSVSTGPLSPFSSIALTSSMSPYLSAFSNARDTPFVASPSRGGIPGTPGSNLNIFDWTMRPPSKPASSTNNTAAKRDSVSMQGGNQPPGNTKRKRGEDDEQNKGDDALLHADADERSAAALLDSLRNAGARPSLAATTATNSGNNGDSASVAPSALSLSSAAPPITTTAGPGISPIATSEPSDSFFDQRNVTAGPEAFLLRLQGGAQEDRLRTLGPDGSLVLPSSGPDHFGQNALDAGGLSLSQFGASNPVPQSSGAWDSIQFGNNATSMAWLLSPGVQQIINTFAGASSLPGDNGSYFSGGAEATQSKGDNLPGVNTFALERALSDVKNPFYIPPHLFRACYSIVHWNLPPITRLSVIALHSQQNLLKHFPIIHEPTFRLDTTPGCLAFAMSMIGCHQHGRMWWAGEEVVAKRSLMGNGSTNGAKSLMQTRFDDEDGQELVRPVVVAEKTDMLMRSFASRAKTQKDRVSVVQSLLLFQSDHFLNSDASTRAMAAMHHTSIVKLAKQAGIFDSNAVHSGRMVSYTGEEVLRSTLFEAGDLCFSYSFLPSYLPSCSDEEKIWRRWSEFAGRRRTAYILFTMDTVASLDVGVPLQVSFSDVAHLPLPTPDTIWRAPTSGVWKKALEQYHGPTLDEALTQLLRPGEESGAKVASIHGRHGPFARLVMIVSLLRGLVHLLEDRKRKVSTLSPLHQWLPDAKPSQFNDEVQVYRAALILWRLAWDDDDLCLAASGPLGRARAAKLSLIDSDMAWMGSHYLFASQTASGATPICDDALPFYWLAYVLLRLATSAEGEQEVVAERQDSSSPSSVLMEKMSELARGGTAKVKEEGVDGNMPDFRSMLRLAKAFVSSGEAHSNIAPFQ